MAAFDRGRQTSRSTIRITSALCAFWCASLASITAFSLKLKIPFDLITKPLLAVEVLSSLITVVHIGHLIVSSARDGSARVKPKKFIKGVCGIVATSIIFHVLAILFGAPVLHSSKETFHFAMLMTSLTAVPAFCVLGADGERWTSVYALGRPALGKETVVYITSISSLAGAWFGAVPIPLDWDRPWQVWPVSCVLGALFGYCLGLLASVVYLPFKYRQISKSKLT